MFIWYYYVYSNTFLVLCICVCVCMFTHLNASTCVVWDTYGVGGQPLVVVLSLQLVWGHVLLLFTTADTRVTGSWASGDSPVSAPELPMENTLITDIHNITKHLCGFWYSNLSLHNYKANTLLVVLFFQLIKISA